MWELVEWLVKMEHLAAEFYENATLLYRDDTDLARLLKRLAEDELLHFKHLESALELIKSRPQYRADIVLDDKTRSKFEALLRESKKNVEAGTLTKDSLLDSIISIEFSEWNDIFLYAVNTLKERKPEFIKLAASIEPHKKIIERYLESHSSFHGYLAKIRQLPDVWKERILVVDDNELIRTILTRLLTVEGAVDTAVNGNEGLHKLMQFYYDMIISDIDMPLMSGIEFYKQALAHYPSITDRFLFFTGDLTSENHDFLKTHKLRYLLKPASVETIMDTVHRVLVASSS
jgi:two-component system chemotaxis response regulator CheY